MHDKSVKWAPPSTEQGAASFLVDGECLPTSVSHADLGLFKGSMPLGKRTRRGQPWCFTGVAGTTKCLGPALFDSLLERDFQTRLEADARVECYAVQPHQLTYWVPNAQGSHTKRLYTPDVVLRLRDGRVLVAEVKASIFTKQQYWLDRVPYIREAYVRDYAVIFIVVTEFQIHVQPTLANCQRMVRYGARFDDDLAIMRVRDALQRLSPISTIEAIIRNAELGNGQSHRAYSALMKLALSGEVTLDMDAPLGAATTVTIKNAIS